MTLLMLASAILVTGCGNGQQARTVVSDETAPRPDELPRVASNTLSAPREAPSAAPADQEYRVIAAAAAQRITPAEGEVCLDREVDASGPAELADAFAPVPGFERAGGVDREYYRVAGKVGTGWRLQPLEAMKLDSKRFIGANSAFAIASGCKHGRLVKVNRPQIRGDFAVVDTFAWQCVFQRVR
jgi:hypothetical protein